MVKKNIYNKYYSFYNFYSNSLDNILLVQKKRAIKLITKYMKKNSKYFDILNFVLMDLNCSGSENKFKINYLVAHEMEKMEDSKIPEYFYHRYRYDIFPDNYKLDRYPPCLQIEPSSICNYRCVFCYQRYLQKHPQQNGTMTFQTYKKIIDQIEGKIQFISLASRGEPFLCKDINKMLEYSKSKFISLKINTNAFFLREDNIHAILKGGVNTIVFSVDNIDKKAYESMRINGDFDRVVKNIKKFHSIKEKYYSDSKIITRISGVNMNKSQDIKKMKDFWGSLVDQIVLVYYCPWENIYKLEKNKIVKSCKELWRRIFVWHNGDINPCENDFLSLLHMGNVKNDSIRDVWRSSSYEKLRNNHLEKNRIGQVPCNTCLMR
jgi:radical SAM protein with 4Fe4S-binding SPASM domain